MTIFIFLIYACFAKEIKINFPAQPYERKLLNYQNITGISDEKMDEIGRLAENPSNARKKTKFRYSTDLILPASQTYIQVKFEIEELNVDSVINGGVFICTYPGIYYFSATLDGAGDATDTIGVHIVHNGLKGAFGRG